MPRFHCALPELGSIPLVNTGISDTCTSSAGDVVRNKIHTIRATCRQAYVSSSGRGRGGETSVTENASTDGTFGRILCSRSHIQQTLGT